MNLLAELKRRNVLRSAGNAWGPAVEPAMRCWSHEPDAGFDCAGRGFEDRRAWRCTGQAGMMNRRTIEGFARQGEDRRTIMDTKSWTGESAVVGAGRNAGGRGRR